MVFGLQLLELAQVTEQEHMRRAAEASRRREARCAVRRERAAGRAGRGSGRCQD